MKLAVVAQSAVAGGAERYLSALHAGLVERGHHPHLLGSIPGWSDAGLPASSIDLSPKWSRKSIASGLRRLPSERRNVESEVRSLKPDLVHVQFKREQLGLTDAIARMAPVVWTEHGRFPSDIRIRAALSVPYRIASKKAAGIVCVSDAVADDVAHVVRGRSRVIVIENAVDTHRLRPPTELERTTAKRALGISDADGPVLLWIGRLHQEKQPMLAVEASNNWPGVTLIVGAGPEASRLEAAAQDRDVRLVGHLADPGAAYRAADVLLFTSTGAGEGFPTTLLEACSHGLPVVANRESGFEAVVRAAGGVVTQADPQALAAAADAIRSKRPSATARSWAEAHDVHLWLDRHENAFRELAGL